MQRSRTKDDAERGRCALDLDTLYAVTEFRPSTGVTLRIVHADTEAYANPPCDGSTRR